MSKWSFVDATLVTEILFTATLDLSGIIKFLMTHEMYTF